MTKNFKFREILKKWSFEQFELVNCEWFIISGQDYVEEGPLKIPPLIELNVAKPTLGETPSPHLVQFDNHVVRFIFKIEVNYYVLFYEFQFVISFATLIFDITSTLARQITVQIFSWLNSNEWRLLVGFTRELHLYPPL